MQNLSSAPSLQIEPTSRDLRIFVRVAGIGFAIWVSLVTILALFAPDYLFIPASTTVFSDFTETLSEALMQNPYRFQNTIYPPLTFLMLYPFALICRGTIDNYTAGILTETEVAKRPEIVLLYLFYFTLHIVLICLLLSRVSGLRGRMRPILIGFVLTFGPFLFCFLRGNSILTSVLFVLIFFTFESHENKWLRECAYLALAIAIAFKIYPILLSIYLLWKYRGRERAFVIGRCALYTLLFVFLPFLAYSGNILVNFKNLLAAALRFSTANGGSPAYTWPTNVSFDTIISYITQAISFVFGGQDVNLLRKILSLLVRLPFLAACVYFALTAHDRRFYREFVTLSCAAYVLLPSVSNGYCLMIMILPFALTLADWKKFTVRERKLYLVAYSLILCGGLYCFGLYICASISVIALALHTMKTIAREQYASNIAARQEG